LRHKKAWLTKKCKSHRKSPGTFTKGRTKNSRPWEGCEGGRPAESGANEEELANLKKKKKNPEKQNKGVVLLLQIGEVEGKQPLQDPVGF